MIFIILLTNQQGFVVWVYDFGGIRSLWIRINIFLFSHQDSHICTSICNADICNAIRWNMYNVSNVCHVLACEITDCVNGIFARPFRSFHTRVFIKSHWDWCQEWEECRVACHHRRAVGPAQPQLATTTTPFPSRSLQYLKGCPKRNLASIKLVCSQRVCSSVLPTFIGSA